MPIKKQGGGTSAPAVAPTAPNPLGENINTKLIGTTLYITNTGLPAYGDPIKTRLDGNILYITSNGTNP